MEGIIFSNPHIPDRIYTPIVGWKVPRKDFFPHLPERRSTLPETVSSSALVVKIHGSIQPVHNMRTLRALEAQGMDAICGIHELVGCTTTTPVVIRGTEEIGHPPVEIAFRLHRKPSESSIEDNVNEGL